MTAVEGFRAADELTRAEIRDRIDLSMLVEAGAGTGKTRALVDRVVALVLSGMLVDRIVAITFTEKAAAELKERVRTALEAESERAGNSALIARALDSLGRASISTIHAFCLTLLRSFAAEAGVDPDFKIEDEVLAGRRFEEQWRSYLEGLGGDFAAVAIVDRVLALGLTTDNIATLAKDLSTRQDIAAVLADQPLRVSPVAGPDLVSLRSRLAAFPLRGVPESDLLLPKIVRLMEEIDELSAARLEERESRLSAIVSSLAKVSYNVVGQRGNWRGVAVTDVRRAAMETREALTAARDGLRSEALAALLPYIVAFVRQDANRRAREGALVFDDLIVRVRDLLATSPAVRAAFRKRYDALLIDEFQDTDPLQVEIALAFACSPTAEEIEPGRLFLVGDPKQSIYRFRRADMGIYARTRRRMEDERGALAVLALNRRSRRIVVEAVNKLFRLLIGPGANLAVQPAYRPIEHERIEELQGPGVATFGGSVDDLARPVRRLEADQIAARCAAIVTDGWEVFDRGLDAIRPASFRDITVLVPTRAILLHLERALAGFDIPYRVEGGSLIYGTQDVRDIINCLTAIDDPADEVAVVAALRSPAYACSDVDLARFRANGGRFNYLSSALVNMEGRVAEGLRSLKDFHEDRHKYSLARVVERFVAERSLVEIGVLDQGNRNAFRRSRFLVEQARVFEATGPESLHAFVAWLEQRAGDTMLDYEGAGLDDDEDAVRVLTIHGAKGLEFPIVILAGLGVAPRPESFVFGVDRSSGSVAVALGSKGQDARFTLGPVSDIEASEREHAAGEKMRLLYVASTRARDHLLVSLYHPARGKDSPAHSLIDAGIRDAAVELPSLPAMPGAVRPPFASLVVDAPPSMAEFEEEHARLIAAASRTLYTSATALGGLALSEEKREREDMTEPWSRGRAGTHVGRAVHAALQGVSWNADSTEIDAIARAQAVAEAVPEHEADVARHVRTALASEAAIRARAGRALREVPFALTRGNTVLEGFIDLVIDTPDGLEIVDWKTDAIPPSEIAKRLQSYELQAGLYVAGLEAATGREVTRVTYVFVSANAERSPGDPATLREAALARLDLA